jgi:hypothetical protein
MAFRISPLRLLADLVVEGGKVNRQNSLRDEADYLYDCFTAATEYPGHRRNGPSHGRLCFCY